MYVLPEKRVALVGGRGESWELDELDLPEPKGHEVLLEVKAASLNRVDIDMLVGAYNGNDSTSDYIAGREAAGIVRQVGRDVSNVRVGDAIMGATPNGGFASYTIMDSRHAVAVPENISWESAGSLPVALSTEHDALVTQANFEPGNSLLILGGSSAIGLIGIQIAKALGAGTVIATTTSDRKRQQLVDVGADFAINTSEVSWAESVLEVTQQEGVDVVLDHLGGDPLAQSLQTVKIGGTIVNIGRLAGRSSMINLDLLSFRRIRLQGTTFSVRTAEERGEVYTALTKEIIPAVRDGVIRPLIDQTFHITEAGSALTQLRSGNTLGKIVLTF